MSRRSIVLAVAAAAYLLAWPSPAAAQKKRVPEKPSDNYDELFVGYLESARATRPTADAPLQPNWMSSLAMDPRARNVNDLVTIRVIESIVASGSADSALSKSSAASASVSKLFGLETKLPDWIDPTNLVGLSSAADFQGAGATNRSGILSAMVTARVVEVLPSGDMLLEGVREIDINGDRQIVVLTGVVRPADIGRNNEVLSTSIGQFRIRYFGRGLIRDNLQPGWLIRVLNKIF